MDIKLLTTFIGLNIANVIIQTIKSLATVKCDKGGRGTCKCNSLWPLYNCNNLHAM